MKKPRHKHKKKAPHRGQAPAQRVSTAAGLEAVRVLARAESAQAFRRLEQQIGRETSDERGLVLLLLLPVLLLAGSLIVSQALRPTQRLIEDIALRVPVPVARPDVARVPLPPVAIETPAAAYPIAAPVIQIPEIAAPLSPFGLELARLAPPVPAPPPEVALVLPGAMPTMPLGPPAVPVIDIATWSPPGPLPALARLPPPVPLPPAEVAIVLPGAMPAMPLGPPAVPVIDIAAWSPPGPLPGLPRLPPPVPLEPLAPAAPEMVCRPAGDRLASLGRPVRPAALGPAASGLSSAAFGLGLVAAARRQMDELVVYSARYQRIAYPLGDIPAFFGACTEVVIRAYRALGIDLQQMVQVMRGGASDASIDHRRTETLRLLFARHGASLPVSSFPEDYRPGDVVTYLRPYSRVSRAHIAIVSDVLAPSGRPMILHNRGWGVQLEDALFVDRITGHYRFQPQAEGAAAATAGRPDAAASGTAMAAGAAAAIAARRAILAKASAPAAAPPKPGRDSRSAAAMPVPRKIR